MSRPAVAVCCVLLLLWSLAVFGLRIASREDNALDQTAAWTARNLPANAVVITEESIGTLIEQPYCKMYRDASCPGAEYLITYQSDTEQPPDDPTINHIMAVDPKLAQFYGFKEHITVYKILGVPSRTSVASRASGTP